MALNKITKKRQRLTLVCENCKKRKIKCDKNSPCTSCIKSNLQNSCTYYSTFDNVNPELPYVSSARTPILLNEYDDQEVIQISKNEFILLKEKIRKLEVLRDNKPGTSRINKIIANQVDSIDISNLTNVDNQTINSIWTINSFIGINPIFNLNDSINFSKVKNGIGIFSDLLLIKEDKSLNLLLKYLYLRKDELILLKDVNKAANDDGEYYIIDENIIEKPVSIEHILKILPAKKVICKLVDYFFSDLVYCNSLILDKSSLALKINKIIGERNDDRLNINENSDITILGNLLILLRLSYISITNGSGPSTKDELVNITINEDFAKLSKICFNLVRKKDKKSPFILQLTLLLKYYNYFGLEINLENSPTTNLNESINLKLLTYDKHEVSIHFLILDDIFNYLIFDSSINVNLIKLLNNNKNDTSQLVNLFYQLILNLNQPLILLVEVLNKFELLFFKVFSNPDLTDLIATNLYLLINFFLISIYFKSFDYFYHINFNISFFYLKKLISFQVDLLLFLKSNQNIKFNLIFQLLIKKMNTINLSLIIKFNFFLIKSNDINYNYFKLIFNLKNLFIMFFKIKMNLLLTNAKDYFYSWNFLNCHLFFYLVISNKEFYDKNINYSKNFYSGFNFNQLNDLILILSKFLCNFDSDVGYNLNHNNFIYSYKWIKLTNQKLTNKNELLFFDIFHEFL